MTSQEVGEGGIMSRDVEEKVCVCVQIGGGPKPRGTWQKRGSLLQRAEEGRKEMFTQKCENTDNDRNREQGETY